MLDENVFINVQSGGVNVRLSAKVLAQSAVENKVEFSDFAETVGNFINLTTSPMAQIRDWREAAFTFYSEALRNTMEDNATSRDINK